MTEGDKNFYFNAERLNVKQTSLKLINKLAKGNKYNEVPLIVTPFMSERFNAQIVPYQVQVAQQQQHQQQQQQDQQLQLQLQQPPQPQDQQQQQQSPHHTPEQSPVQSPIPQRQFPSYEDEPLPFDFFEAQPSSSAPTQPTAQPQYSPPSQSTSQPLPSDSAIDPDLQAFRDDLQPASNEPDNTQVHNPADDSFQPTVSSPNTSTNTTSKPVKKVARKRSLSSLMDQPAALSSQKKQRGTLVVYTGTAGAMSEPRDERQTPSDTHAREASETALSVREEDNYDAFPKEMDDDDVFDATYCQNHEDGAFDEAYVFQTEEEVVDQEHEELVRKFKQENEARKRKLRDFQKLLEDKLITEEEIKKEKQKIYDAACVQKNLDVKHKVYT
ncbi:uncharacterized protein LOC135147895 [Daucus carota subsp. sativus]|uniref:uncharacterized protein LOC135147895 n=1 Tax=Daucus carota subsp. sativus TaxID=79200 RepID=UPI0030826E46